ncbi:myelocytomatosis oncogene homolog [Lepisosteus oculatus]|uniref:myelocytomatosis oncogene homolog n=1 Tax=Lepisosteus oculatus TaxID=7918 RepID=UPI0035F51942
MPQSCLSPCRDWDGSSEPLLFDEEFCRVLLKDFQMFPTPPQSPPIKPGFEEPLSTLDRLELMSELLMEDPDLIQHSLGWPGELSPPRGAAPPAGGKDQRPAVSEDCLWRGASEKCAEEKLSASPLLSDIDTRIFEEIAATTLDCHGAALAGPLQDSLERSACSSEDGSLSAGSSSSSSSSSSDSEEEIDVVTVRRRRRAWSAGRRARHAEGQRAAKRRHLDIQQQHNYAAPCPSPRRPEPKRARAEPARPPSAAGRPRPPAAGPASDPEEEERRRTHNVMERQRRSELKGCFLRLRDHVPELSRNDKASKVLILKKAREHIRGLEAQGRALEAARDAARRRQEQLQHSLGRLRRRKAAP